MDTEITPTQLAIEYLRRDKSNLSRAVPEKLKQLELEFTDLLALFKRTERRDSLCPAVGRSRPLSSEEKAASAAFLCLTFSIWQAVC